MEQSRAVGYKIINLIRKQQTNTDKSMEPNDRQERQNHTYTSIHTIKISDGKTTPSVSKKESKSICKQYNLAVFAFLIDNNKLARKYSI